MQTSGTFPALNSGMTGSPSAPKPPSSSARQQFPAYYKRTGLQRGKTPPVPAVGGKRRKGQAPRAGFGATNPFLNMMPMINKAVRGY